MVTVPDPNPVQRVRSVCSYCGVGCGLLLDVAVDGATGRRTVTRASGDRNHPVNGGRLCTKGATTAEMLAAPGRLGTALVRDERGAEARPEDVDAAITATARRLRAVLDEHGPDALAFYVSGQLTLEAQYLVNKLAKGFVRTNRIESNSRLCMASAGSGYKLSLGADGPPGSYRDLDHADVFLVIGSNMADCHPILFLRMMDRVRKAGAKLIVVDPRRTATADKADLFLRIRPGTDLALLNGLLHLLVENGDTDPAFIEEFTEGWEQMPGFLGDYPPAEVARITGLAEEDIRAAARLIGAAAEWTSCWTMGLNQSTHGTWNTNALVNLHLATGAICRPGSGPFSLTGQPNAMGGREMGYMGPGLPGQRSVLDPAERAFTEELWGLPPGTLRTEVGRGTVEMFSRMAEGRSRRAGSSAPIRSPRSPTGRPSSPGWRPPNSSSPRTCSPTPRPTPTPTWCCPPPSGPRRRGCWSTRSAASPWPGRPSTRSAGRCRTGASSPGWPARWASPRASTTRARRRSSRS